jgi:hypothetical protein
METQKAGFNLFFIPLIKLHETLYLPGFIKFDQGISEKSDGQNCAESGIIRIVIITRIAIAKQ